MNFGPFGVIWETFLGGTHLGDHLLKGNVPVWPPGGPGTFFKRFDNFEVGFGLRFGVRFLILF